MKILELELITNHSLQELADFYTKFLNKPPLEYTDQYLKLQVGTSQLSFKYLKSAQSSRYHFAINIPQNQFEAANLWISRQVSLIADNEGESVFYSENWDATNLYFYDPAGNILELIARHTLDNKSDEVFGAQSLLNISEIGITADDVVKQVNALKTKINANPYRWSGSTEFTPVGDEHGLFIVVKRGRIWFPDTGISAEHLPVTTLVEQNDRTTKLSFS